VWTSVHGDRSARVEWETRQCEFLMGEEGGCKGLTC
jgi:hypothetical protein